MRFSGIGIKRNLFLRNSPAADLIGHLYVLMRPHIRCCRSRKTVKGFFFQQIPPEGIACHRQKDLAGIHGFRHAAAFASLDGRIPGQAFIPRKMSCHHTVIPHHLLIHLPGEGIPVLPGDKRHQRPGFQRHCRIHHMIQLRPVFVCSRMSEVKMFIKLFITQPLGIQNIHELKHPFLRTPFIKPQKRDQTFVPPRRSPIKKGVAGYVPQQVFHSPADR